MTVATYTSDLTDINLFETTTGITATGGGGAGLSAAVDFAMEGTNAVQKQVGKAGGETKGFMYDNGSNFTIGADDHFFMWVAVSTPGICNFLEFRIGDDPATNTARYSIAEKDGPGGFDDAPYEDLAGECYCVRFNNSASEGDGNFATDGSPSTTPSWIGARLNVGVAVKADNFALDAARIGTGYDILNGTGADPEANFAGISADDVSTSEGILQPLAGGYRLLGKLRIGSSATACEFLDSNLFIGIKVTGHCFDDFSEILIENASSIVTLDNITFKGLYTQNRGRFDMITSSATVDLTNCTFLEFGATVLGTGATCSGCSWVNCNIITANGADLTGSSISDYEETVNTSPLIWDVATDPDGLLDDMAISKGTLATHAIEFGTTSPLTMTLNGMSFSDYNSSDAQNDSTFHIKRTSGTVTLNINTSVGEFSFRTDGATVVIVISPVTLTLTVTDIDTGSAIENARVFITPEDNTGPFPFEESVTLTQVSNTVTAVHTAHGMINSQKVQISGANESEYNGVYTISSVTANGYEYTITGDPDSPATGTIIATAVIIDGLTNASGIIADTRSHSSDQPITGRVRKSSASPFYKTSPVTGTIDSDDGLSIAVQMIRDE